MSSIRKAAARRRTYLLASTFLVPVLSLSISAAKAQQSASPNLLPSIEVEAPADKKRAHPEPAPEQPSASRRAVPAGQQSATDAKPSGKPDKETAVVVSPTATVTPVDQVASSVTVITAKDMERDQRRTAPDALATVPGLNVVQSGGPGGLT
jgi:vitamin B12 transporter